MTLALLLSLIVPPNVPLVVSLVVLLVGLSEQSAEPDVVANRNARNRFQISTYSSCVPTKKQTGTVSTNECVCVWGGGHE